MRLPALPAPLGKSDELPIWPPLLATRGPGSASDLHAHHALHFLIAIEGELRVRAARSGTWKTAAGVLTAPDAAHAIDARGVEVLLVFLDPESDAGAALVPMLGGSNRLLSREERDMLAKDGDPRSIMRRGGVEWTRGATRALGASTVPRDREVHPRVRKLLRLLRAAGGGDRTSLDALSNAVGLSPSRLMHVFTSSIGVPLRPYLAWLKLQRAAGAIVAGLPLTDAAYAAGFADAAHMSRTFRRMFGVSPSALRPRHDAAS